MTVALNSEHIFEVNRKPEFPVPQEFEQNKQQQKELDNEIGVELNLSN